MNSQLPWPRIGHHWFRRNEISLGTKTWAYILHNYKSSNEVVLMAYVYNEISTEILFERGPLMLGIDFNFLNVRTPRLENDVDVNRLILWYNLPVDIVVELVVAGKGQKNSESGPKREEDLRRRVHPNLSTW